MIPHSHPDVGTCEVRLVEGGAQVLRADPTVLVAVALLTAAAAGDVPHARYAEPLLTFDTLDGPLVYRVRRDRPCSLCLAFEMDREQ